MGGQWLWRVMHGSGGLTGFGWFLTLYNLSSQWTSHGHLRRQWLPESEFLSSVISWPKSMSKVQLLLWSRSALRVSCFAFCQEFCPCNGSCPSSGWNAWGLEPALAFKWVLSSSLGCSWYLLSSVNVHHDVLWRLCSESAYHYCALLLFLSLQGKLSSLFFGFFTWNINGDVLIGWSARMIDSPEPAVCFCCWFLFLFPSSHPVETFVVDFCFCFQALGPVETKFYIPLLKFVFKVLL